MRHLAKHESGASLLMVIMTLMVLSILGAALATVSFAHVKLTTTDRDYQATYYIAEAGVNQAYTGIKATVLSTYEKNESEATFYNQLNALLSLNATYETYDDFNLSFNEQPHAVVRIEQISEANPRDYKIISTGTIGKRERTVERKFTVNWTGKDRGGVPSLPKGSAAIVRNQIDLRNSGAIRGDAYLASNKPKTILIDNGGGERVSGTIYVPEESLESALNTAGFKPTLSPHQSSVSWESIDSIIQGFPEFPTYDFHKETTINYNGHVYEVIKNGNLHVDNWIVRDSGFILDLEDNYRFNSLIFNSNYKLKMQLNGAVRNIVVDHLDISNGHIEIIGDGTVNLFVRNRLTLGSGSSINAGGDRSKVNIYYLGSDNIIMNGSQSINGSLFLKTANITITSGANFNGFLVSGGNEINLSGGTFNNMLLIAPFANLNLLGGAKLNGLSVSNKLYIEGGAFINYLDFNFDGFPFGNGQANVEPIDLITPHPPTETH
ncbi:hypothetical protein SAMN04488134_11915 [Amphibacillus marinus]|uniref:PilX N-terminal n=1 Tax=Amphibacillus marinus TaxID=872970 RepID=A0A1H8TTT2_9BACI|nr:pilus assembly PilX N-terminal domain-containing protein [Amphibacillus marinus]SEO93828.1 hypothetical protein SAMN04488134_11915 [Amphibacillus marinus]